MKAITLIILSQLLVTMTVGCQSSPNRTAEGAVIGGLLGAAGGGIIGHQSGHGGEGAGIGAAAGALTGALVGSQIKKPSQGGTQPAQSAPANNPNQMSIQQIADLSKSGAHEAVIIDKIRMTNSKFKLTQDDINYLKQQGVSQNVINVMQGM